MRVAVPTNHPGGLDAERADHFGHCDHFTIIDISAEKTVGGVSVIENHGHRAGGCMEPVRLLEEAGVNAIIVGGLGARPMSGMIRAGIQIHFAPPQFPSSVSKLVEKFLGGDLPRMQSDQVCKGSADCSL